MHHVVCNIKYKFHINKHVHPLRKTIFQMGAYKSPRPDDISSVNHTFKALIPKTSNIKDNPSKPDNIVINHEIMYYLNKKKGKNGYMAIKLDLAKAYDRLEWGILEELMYKYRFHDKIVDWIKECITTPKISILLNGSRFGFFAAHRGLRQGDPMSPALFTILSDLLSRLLLRAGAEGKIKGVKISRTSPAITHILYADDTVVYCRPNIANATEIKHIL